MTASAKARWRLPVLRHPAEIRHAARVAVAVGAAFALGAIFRPPQAAPVGWSANGPARPCASRPS
jgi:hypothetical protein